MLTYCYYIYSYYQEWIRKGREYLTPVYLSVKALFVIQSTPVYV